MPIKFKAISKAQPGVVGGGTQKFYAHTVLDGVIDIPELCKEIEKISTVSETDVMAVLMGLVTVVPDKLADSRMVRLGELGTFRPSVSSKGHDEEKEVSSNSIKGNKVLFRPGNRITNVMKLAKYKKIS